MQKYKLANESFFGKLSIKLVSEIVLAVFVGVAIFISSTMYSNATRISDENRLYNNVSIGLDGKYIDSLFGIPKMSFPENADILLTNHIYVLKGSFLRTVLDANNTVVAFFVTSVEKGRVIPLNVPYQNKRITIGKNSFYSISDDPNVEIHDLGSGTYYNHYSESFSKNHPDTFCCAFINFGVATDKSSQLLLSYATGVYRSKNRLELSDVEKYRQQAIPNTFGIITSEYSDKIEIVPNYDRYFDLLNH